ncbi:hypothetical protein D3C71_2054200 [compost metagenome]
MENTFTIVEMRAMVREMAERYRQRELEGMRVLPHSRELERRSLKPKIRVKAGSRRWSLSNELSRGTVVQ